MTGSITAPPPPRVLGSSGPAVLLLPGGAEQVEGFFPGLAEGLLEEPGCRVILWDRPGVSGTPGDVLLADAADHVHEMLSAHGLGPVVAIGQSLGGAVALLTAVQHPDDIAGLVLLDPTPINDPRICRQLGRSLRLLAGIRPRSLRKVLAGRLVNSAGKKLLRRPDLRPEARPAIQRTMQLDLDLLARSVVGINDVAVRFDPARLRHVPAAVVTADRKESSPIRKAHVRLAQALGTTVLAWPTAEHSVHLTHPDEVLDAARHVVRRVT
ncbi:alpha/beta fold hydrolase [Nakamurella sp. YIM 132087]|uniref:Alpha/beta fold hydrolase n=1 Tax=Nakamurella alba TaxID=2665158 RepID=A0A7K1FFY9_9ACTN|nr:alpha/beta hydrolase [Nakamurella alba]MTD12389.1 alpha/beta fold hydrolase [Nakamurella alba]